VRILEGRGRQLAWKAYHPSRCGKRPVTTMQVLGQAADSAAGTLLTDESICKAVQAAFMLGDPVKKPKEYGGTRRDSNSRDCVLPELCYHSGKAGPQSSTTRLLQGIGRAR
jgi:hypothetical protein